MNLPEHERFMKRCLELAQLGLGNVQPNPMVGSVIVANQTIIGEGWHRSYGSPHAEVHAIEAVKDQALLPESTLYVNLEPCSHYGKTPPCADAIIRYQIPKVVIGTVDIHSKVNGEGIKKLQHAGIEVVSGVLAPECMELNKRFFTFHKKQRPYVILKWAQTSDGFMDIDRSAPAVQPSYWITNQELRVIVHKWRSEEDAILVGYNTVQNDNPQLNNRYFAGKSPVRVVMERESAEEIVHRLHQQNIQSVLVEGGRKTLEKFINSNLWDEARILTGNQKWGKGLPAPSFSQAPEHEEIINHNSIRYYYKTISGEF